MGPLSQALTAANVAALKSQGVYMNFHTAVNPGGAIRGTLNRSLLSTSATNASQMAVANALDVSAGYNTELDQILMAKAVASSADRTDTLQALSGHTLYADGRQAVETMVDAQEVLFAQTAAPTVGGGFFAAAGESFGKRDSDVGQAGSKISRPSLLVGFDSGDNSGMHGGFAIGYANGKDKFKGGAGETEAKTTSVHGFVASGGDGVQFAATVGYGKSKFDTTRRLTTVARTATSSHDGSVWNLGAKVSGPVAADALSISPYGQIDMQRAKIDAYTEAGGGPVGLIVPMHKEKNTAVEAGAALNLPMKGASGEMTVRLQAGWRYNLDGGGGTIATGMVGTPVTFSTVIKSPDKSSAHIAASVTGQLGPKVSASAGYRGYISSHNDVHLLQLRIAMAL